MKTIQMVDLQGQYKKIKTDVQSAIDKVMNTASFINGEAVQSFSKELESYLGVKHVIPCANGTDALQIALMSLNLKEGDEIITTDFTFAATVEVIALLKLTPVLVDVNPKDFNIDSNAIKKAITSKTKAIILVHLFGQCSDMEQICDIAKTHNLHIIEDTAQAIGATYTFSNGTTTKAGTIGTIGTTSFFPSKNLGCYGDGGAIFTNDNALAHYIRGLCNHGMYERYHHDVVGVNSRLDSIQAAVLSCKLPLLDTYNAKRQIAAEKYNNRFKNHPKIEIPFLNLKSTHVFHQYTLKVKGDRNGLVKFLGEHHIPTGVYYPIPLHSQKAYKNDRYNNHDFYNTDKLCQQVISLPMHTELTDDQIDFITSKVLEYLNS